MKRIALIACAICLMTCPLMASDVPVSDQTPSNAVRMDIAPRPSADTPEETSQEAVAPELQMDKSEEMATATMEPAPPAIEVKELVIAQSISEREPVSPSDTFEFGVERLYSFSRIASEEAATITHVWYRNDVRLAEVPLNVGPSASWRTWSSKAVAGQGPSDWRVEILSEDGQVLAETRFTIQ